MWGAYVLAPWANRIAPLPTRVGDRVVDVPANFPDGSAIHGQVFLGPWRAAGEGRYEVDGGGDGWPWRYRAGLSIDALNGSLVIEQRLENRDTVRMPGGLGFHPWFRRPVIARFGASLVLADVHDESPEPSPVAGVLDLREQRELPSWLDAAWTELADPPVELAWPELGIRLTMRAAPLRWLVCATPPDRPAGAIEPQTHAPNGLRRLLDGHAGSLDWIAPGEALRQRVELRITRG